MKTLRKLIRALLPLPLYLRWLRFKLACYEWWYDFPDEYMMELPSIRERIQRQARSKGGRLAL